MACLRVFAATAAACLVPAAAFAQWSENFDSYATGSINGMGGWKGWANAPANAGTVVNTQSLSAPNSLQAVGITDCVHEYSGYTSGQWRYTANVFVPTSFTVTNEVAWFILMSDYTDPGTANHWSVQIEMTAAGMVSDPFDGGTTTPTSLVRGQWVPITVDIDLGANTKVEKYNGTTILSAPWKDLTGGTANIGAVDLYANSPDDLTGGNTVPFFYDNLSLAAVPEPATMTALALGIVTLIRRRRK